MSIGSHVMAIIIIALAIVAGNWLTAMLRGRGIMP